MLSSQAIPSIKVESEKRKEKLLLHQNEKSFAAHEYIRKDNKGDREHPGEFPQDNTIFSV